MIMSVSTVIIRKGSYAYHTIAYDKILPVLNNQIKEISNHTVVEKAS